MITHQLTLTWICYIHIQQYKCLVSLEVYMHFCWAFQVVLVVKNTPANAGNIRDVGSIPGSGRSPGGRLVNLLQYSCLENLMHRGAWRATVHRVTNSWTWQKHMHFHYICTDKSKCCITFMCTNATWSLFHILCFSSHCLNYDIDK